MNEKDMLQIKTSLTMPAELADALAKNLKTPEKQQCRHIRSGHYRRLCAAAAAFLCICAAGSTSLAYNVYQEKQLVVFMEADLSQAEIDYIGQEIARMGGLSSSQYTVSQYVSGDEAWEKFKAAYLTDENGEELTELTESIQGNPLADSFNYRVSVRMTADTQDVRDQISRLPGVRKITTVREAERAESAKN